MCMDGTWSLDQSIPLSFTEGYAGIILFCFITCWGHRESHVLLFMFMPIDTPYLRLNTKLNINPVLI